MGTGMTHEFGIMERAPKPGERYDRYEPWNYALVSIHDDDIQPLAPRLDAIDMFWHTVDVPGKGLACCGVTLIPPAAFPAVLEVIRPVAGLRPLADLVGRAAREGKYIIHYGL